MSLITRCPTCGTLFRVVEDQLKVSDGWVRCGQCNEVFDARLHIQAETVIDKPKPPPQPQSQPQPQQRPQPPQASQPSGAAAQPAASTRPANGRPAGAGASRWPASGGLGDSQIATDSIASYADSMRANSGFLPSKPGLPPPTSRPGGTSKEDIEQELLAFARQRELDASPFASGAEPPGFEPPRWQASRPPSLPAPAPAHVRAVGFAASRPHSATIDSSEQDHEGASSFMVPLDTLDSVDPDHPQDAKRVGMPASRSFEHTGSSYLGVNSTQHDSLPSLPDSRAEALQSPAAKPEALPSFVQQARREARWRSPWVRAVMGLLALTLAALLLAQLAVHHRNLLAAHYPESHPWLNQLCEPLACQVDHLQRIESIVVDASGFNKLAPAGSGTTNAREAYKLSLTLRNTHSLDIALPHIELSLQDAQEQTVLRRVLAPADLGGTTNTLAARGEWAGSATLQLESALKDGARIAGYRIIAFYP